MGREGVAFYTVRDAKLESLQPASPFPLQVSQARKVFLVLWASLELKEQWVSVPKERMQWVCPILVIIMALGLRSFQNHLSCSLIRPPPWWRYH